MRGLLRATVLGWLLVFCTSQVQAADDATAAKALLEKALAYYHDQGDKAFAAFSRQGSSSTRTVMCLWSIPRG